MKKLFRVFTILIVVIASMYLSSCNNGKQKIDKMQEQIDSLEKVDEERKNDIRDLTGFITTLSDGLDSIAAQEDMLFTNKGVEGVYVDRKQLRLNLEMFEEKLIQQKQRIAQMGDSLKAKGAKIDILNGLVKHLNQQLDEKNRQIQILKVELEKKNVNLAQLRSRVSSLSETNAQLSERAEQQLAALKAQDEVINEGYVKIGTKKELVSGGFLSGGFLKKTKVDVNGLQKDRFSKVDIRSFSELPINATSAKIMTQMPQSSYRWIKAGDGRLVLQITDPTTFWSASNFLIIQIN